MSVVLKYMSMPKNCDQCQLRGSCNKRVYTEDRPKYCPLEEMPHLKYSFWVPVTERLPKMCERVLTYSQREGIRDNFINGYNQWDRVRFGRVTHWMELPQPPKEGE